MNIVTSLRSICPMILLILVVNCEANAQSCITYEMKLQAAACIGQASTSGKYEGIACTEAQNTALAYGKDKITNFCKNLGYKSVSNCTFIPDYPNNTNNPCTKSSWWLCLGTGSRENVSGKVSCDCCSNGTCSTATTSTKPLTPGSSIASAQTTTPPTATCLTEAPSNTALQAGQEILSSSPVIASTTVKAY